METFVQKLARKKDREQVITILPMLHADRHEHEAGCSCGGEGCGDGADGGCCGS